jgi:hypothetical protein
MDGTLRGRLGAQQYRTPVGLGRRPLMLDELHAPAHVIPPGKQSYHPQLHAEAWGVLANQ